MNKYAFKIIGMDCSEEIAILKHALSPFVANENQLGFDLLNGKLTIEPDNEMLLESQFIQAIQKTGMKTIPWQTYITEAQEPQNFWTKHNHLIMTLLSAVFLFLGYSLHAMEHGLS